MIGRGWHRGRQRQKRGEELAVYRDSTQQMRALCSVLDVNMPAARTNERVTSYSDLRNATTDNSRVGAQ